MPKLNKISVSPLPQCLPFSPPHYRQPARVLSRSFSLPDPTASDRSPTFYSGLSRRRWQGGEVETEAGMQDQSVFLSDGEDGGKSQRQLLDGDRGAEVGGRKPVDQQRCAYADVSAETYQADDVTEPDHQRGECACRGASCSGRGKLSEGVGEECHTTSIPPPHVITWAVFVFGAVRRRGTGLEERQGVL
ncbi:hypothetical protein BD309DRAFT_983113 [Dichomitus squalens]|nr:hypothetical protein BD309DRAFT_983113 [Dichomitus squalens]